MTYEELELELAHERAHNEQIMAALEQERAATEAERARRRNVEEALRALLDAHLPSGRTSTCATATIQAARDVLEGRA